MQPLKKTSPATACTRSFAKLIAVIALMSIPLLRAAADDVAILRERLLAQSMSANPSSSTISGYITSQQADGSWTNIDYDDDSVASWRPVRHLRQLKEMAVAYQKDGNTYYQDESLLAAIEDGLAYWLERNPRSENWWWNDLGSNQQMAPFLLVIQGAIPDELFQAAKEKIIPRVIGNAQNRVWYSELVIQRAVMENDAELIQTGVDGIASTIVITLEQGIQIDGSFHQHDEQLYNGGYGYEYLTNVLPWWELLAGTEFMFNEETRAVIATLVLEGFGWMIRYGTVDNSVIGRYIARGSSGSSRLKSPLNILISTGDEHQAGYQALLDHINYKDESHPYIEGQKHFWRSDYSVNRRAGFMVSTRTFSVRTLGGEIAIGENLRGFYLPFGGTFIYRDGYEYDDIMPVWDWYKIPGVTAENPLEGQPTENVGKGKAWFVGGVSNGRYGMSAFDHFDSRSDVTCMKSWFYFDQGFTSLAADIRIDTDYPAFTSVNQCLLRNGNEGSLGQVMASNGGEPEEIPLGEHTLTGNAWVYHDGIGYIFPENPDVYLRTGPQTGAWKDIRESSSASPVTKNVFLLGLDHGTGYDNPRDFVYTVLPVRDMNIVADFSANNPIKVLSNTRDLQAVRHMDEKVTGISFFAPGTLLIEPDLHISTDTRCIVLVTEGDESLEISVANPMAHFLSPDQEIRLRISGSYSGPGASFNPSTGETELLYELPGTSLSGSSIIHNYMRNEISDGLLIGKWARMDFSWVYGLTNTWGYSDFMGYVFVPNYPYVYAPEPGWMYHAWQNGSDHLFYNTDQGWIFVSESNGGWYYHFTDSPEDGSWLRFEQ